MLNRQACFEHAVSTIASQKAWSARVQQRLEGYAVRCLYRGDNGCRCAVGALIPDSAYHASYEYKIASIVASFATIDPRFGAPEGEDFSFLDAMQSAVHDSLSYTGEGETLNPFDIDTLLHAAHKFARRWGFNPTFLDSLRPAKAA